MSLFKKPKRNFRGRTSRHDSDEENNGKGDDDGAKKLPYIPGLGGDELPHESTTEKKTKNKGALFGSSSSKNNGKVDKSKLGTLSFEHEEDEDDGEVFKVKKSSYSRRLAKQMEKERKKKKSKDDDPHPSSLFPLDDGDDDDKKQLDDEHDEFRIVNGEDLQEMDLDSEDEERADEPTPDPFKKILESGSIPDAALIHAARKRRQMAREMSDFITLDNGQNVEKGNSRLIRDDDNDRSDDEDSGGRLSFSVTTPLAKDRAREAFLAMSQKDSQAGSDEEADEELERWEQEQIRKGVSIPQVQLLQEESQFYPSYPVEPTVLSSYPPTGDVYLTSSVFRADPSLMAALSDPSNKTPALTVAQIKQHLTDRLSSLEQVRRAHVLERDKRVDDLINYKSSIVELEEKKPGVASAFTFYQEKCWYVTDLVECLNEKVVAINMLERNFMQLLKQKATRLVQRRQQDIKDQSEEFPAVFSKATNVVQADLLNREKNAADTARARRAAEREGRRTRRRRFREAKGTNIKHYEGMSSDDEEMEADISQFVTEKERLKVEAEAVFEDVQEEYHSVGLIKNQFEQWKYEYPETYTNAYIGLCLPKVFMPFVRLDLMMWNPTEECSDFEESRWYESLMFYSYRDGLTQNDLRKDSDVKIIPFLIERVIIPKLTEITEKVWDPMSTSQTLRLGNVIRKLMNEYPTVNGKSKKTLELLKAIVARMRKTLDDDVFIPTYPKHIYENKSLGANIFFQRQYWTCVKLLRNFCSWQGIITDKLLQELALNGLLNRYLLWALRNSPVNKDSLEKAKTITTTIPRCWFTQKPADNTISQLEMFCRYLRSLADSFDKNGVNGSMSDKAEAKENIKEIAKMLVNIGAMDHALNIMNQFSLRDLKSMVTSAD